MESSGEMVLRCGWGEGERKRRKGAFEIGCGLEEENEKKKKGIRYREFEQENGSREGNRRFYQV